jgi:hypothetical protein
MRFSLLGPLVVTDGTGGLIMPAGPQLRFCWPRLCCTRTCGSGRGAGRDGAGRVSGSSGSGYAAFLDMAPTKNGSTARSAQPRCSRFEGNPGGRMSCSSGCLARSSLAVTWAASGWLSSPPCSSAVPSRGGPATRSRPCPAALAVRRSRLASYWPRVMYTGQAPGMKEIHSSLAAAATSFSRRAAGGSGAARR